MPLAVAYRVVDVSTVGEWVALRGAGGFDVGSVDGRGAALAKS